MRKIQKGNTVSKKILYIVNVHENEVANIDIEGVRQKLDLREDSEVIPISAKVESELIGFSDEEAKEYLESL